MCQAGGGPRSAAEPVLVGLHFPVLVAFRRLIGPLPASTSTAVAILACATVTPLIRGKSTIDQTRGECKIKESEGIRYR